MTSGRRVWLLIAAVTVAATALTASTVTRLPSPDDVPGHPLLLLGLLVAGFAAAELAVVYLPIGRNAYSLTLNELPLVVGLFLLSPLAFVAARLLGAAAPLAWRNRRSPVKLAFNLAQYALEASTVAVVYHLVLTGSSSLSPIGWLAVGTAVVTSDLVGTVLLTLVIAAHTGSRPELTRDVVSLGPVVPLVNASFALVLVYVVAVDWRAVWTVGVVVAVLVFALRAQDGLRRRTESLEQLGQFTGHMGSLLDVDSVATEALPWVSRVLKAEVVELTLAPGFAGRERRWVAGYETPAADLDGPANASAFAPWLAEGPVLVRRRSRDRALSAAVRGAGLRDVVVMELQGDGGAVGTLLVGDRLGDVESFGRGDLRELRAISNHLSVALHNARRADLIREHADEALHRSMHDDLTGLPNRGHLEERLAETMAAGRAASVVLLDLDRFKEVNDTLGHRTGDTLLQMVADRLRRTAPEHALVARLGGDEFAMLLPDSDESATTAVVALVRHSLTRPFEIGDLAVTVEASVGVASSGGEECDLVRQADIAMYVAKDRRTGVEAYRPELDEGTPRRLTMLTELRHAISHGELVVHFQPKVRLADGVVVGAEALVRWIHPERGVIPPDEFVPVAEHSGLITPLTHAVLRQSLDACERWRRAGRPLGVAVNISPRSLLDPSFVDEVVRAVAAVEVPASALTLEITESSLMSDPDRAVAAMQRLCSLGVALSIDDLGTGYSSLAYLQRLPAAELKIDRSFLRPGSEDDDEAFAIVGAVIDLGHRLGRKVVAEGVEDEQTWRRLQRAGCDSAQGYWMSRPLAAETFDEWLAEWRPPAVTTLRAMA